MNLYTKGRIYRYTGLFLARREEAEFKASDRCLVEALNLKLNDDELSLKDAQNILIGSWQVKYGFYRPIAWCRFNRPSWFWAPIGHLLECFMAIRDDLFFRRTRVRKKG